MNPMLMFQFHLVAVVFEEPEVDRQLVGIFRGSDAAEAHRPIIPIEFRKASIGVPARIRGKIPRTVRHESQAQEPLARVDVEGIFVEEVEDAEVAGNQDESPAVVGSAELHGARLLYDAVAAESESLFQISPRMIDRGRLTAAFLQLEILDGGAQAPELGKRALRYELRDQVGFGAAPKPNAQEQGCGAGEAPLGGGKKRIYAAVQIGIGRRERR